MKFEIEDPKPIALEEAVKDDPEAKKLLDQQAKRVLTPSLDLAKVEEPPTTTEVATFKESLSQAPAVRNLTNEININDPMTIHQFGAKAGESINTISKKLLENTEAIKATEISEMMLNLTKVMNSFRTQDYDIDALSGKKGFFKRKKEELKDVIQRMMDRSNNLAQNVDRIAKQLERYGRDINTANVNLNRMYEANKQAFQQLEMYVVACGLGLDEIRTEQARVQSDLGMSEETRSFYMRKLDDNYSLLEQRQSDLQTAELVSLQMMPTLAMMMQTNHRLIAKINTSFIITLPIFRMGLVMAVMAQRQKIEANSIAQLEEATNKLYEQNARQVMQNAVEMERQANSNAIKLETVEKVQQIIMQGIDDVDNVTKQMSAERVENMEKMKGYITEMKGKGF